MTRFGVCVLLLAAVALTGCRLAEHGRRAAIDAFASFVLGSVLQAPPLTQNRVGQALLPVPVASKATVAPPAEDRHECLSYIEIETTPLPKPQPRIASIDLKPAIAIELCRIERISPADLARARVAARMALAEVRGTRIRRIVVVADPSAAL